MATPNVYTNGTWIDFSRSGIWQRQITIADGNSVNDGSRWINTNHITSAAAIIVISVFPAAYGLLSQFLFWLFGGLYYRFLKCDDDNTTTEDDETSALNPPDYAVRPRLGFYSHFGEMICWPKTRNSAVRTLLELTNTMIRAKRMKSTLPLRFWRNSICSVLLILWVSACLVISTFFIYEIALSSIISDNIVLSDSPNCGVWALEKEMAGEPVAEFFEHYYSQELEARNYAQQCFGSRKGTDNDYCHFFVAPNFPVIETDYVDCPFSDNLCVGGATSAFTLSTNLVSSRDLGINVPKGHLFQRTATCTPLKRDGYVFVSSDSTSYEYYYGPNANFGKPTWTSPLNQALNLSRYTMGTVSSLYDDWIPLEEFDKSRNKSITLMFIQSNNIYHTGESHDPIFPAESPFYTTSHQELYYNADPRATVLACVDENEICHPSGSPCFPDIHRPESDPRDHLEKVGYYMLMLSLRPSSIASALHYGGGNALDAASRLIGNRSMRLSRDQWKVEARLAFEASLARMQITLRDLVRGTAAEQNGMKNYTASGIQDMCHTYKFRSVGWRNVSVARLWLFVFIAALLYVLGFKVEVEVMQDNEAWHKGALYGSLLTASPAMSGYSELNPEQNYRTKETRLVAGMIISWFWTQIRKYFPVKAPRRRQAKMKDYEVSQDRDYAESTPILNKIPCLKRNPPLYNSSPNSVTRTCLELDDKLKEIKNMLIRTFNRASWISKQTSNGDNQSDIKVRCFTVEWDLFSFMKQYIDDGSGADVGSVLTISGSSLLGSATTCAAYLEHNWPSTGSNVLSALQKAIDTEEQTVSVQFPDLGIIIELTEPTRVLVQARDETVIEVAQILAWVGAACRSSQSDQIEFCDAKIRQAEILTPHHPVHFYITFDTAPLTKEERSCWHHLFCNPVIARGFPTPPRSQESGLEIPLEIMATLGGVMHAFEFEGGIVLKGFSIAFVPVGYKNGIVQWHCTRSTDNAQLSYRQAVQECPNRLFMSDFNFDHLQSSRSILGWWPIAEPHFGAASVNYDKISWSNAPEATRSITLSSMQLGGQQFATGSLNFTIPAKDQRLFVKRQPLPLKVMIDIASKKPVALYDSVEKRCWLGSAADAILHMALTKLLRPSHIKYENLDSLSFSDPVRYRFDASRVCLQENLSVKLIGKVECDDVKDRDYYFSELFLDLFQWLEMMSERVVQQSSNPGKPVRGTLRDKLRGWEFMGPIDDVPVLRQREVNIEKTSGGWLNLVGDNDAVVLIASGLGDLIKPVETEKGLCPKWKLLPKERNYMAVGVPILNMFFERAGPQQIRKKLTNTGLQWHQASYLFEACPERGSFQCSCRRLQQLFYKGPSLFGKINPPGPLDERGAVVFGKNRLLSGPVAPDSYPPHSIQHKKIVASAILAEPQVSPQDQGTALASSDSSHQYTVLDEKMNSTVPRKSDPVLITAVSFSTPAKSLEKICDDPHQSLETQTF